MARRDLRIEFPSRGATYGHERYGVYEYGVYPRHSVLAGMESRTYRGCYGTLEEAKAAFPEAEVVSGSCSHPVDLSFLPGEDDPDNW